MTSVSGESVFGGAGSGSVTSIVVKANFISAFASPGAASIVKLVTTKRAKETIFGMCFSLSVGS